MSQAQIAMSAASLAVRVCARMTSLDPIRAKKFALTAASFAVRVCSNAWLPVAILGVQVAVVTTSSAGATVFARILLDVGSTTLATVKSLPAVANHHLSVVSKRLLSEPQLSENAPRRAGEDVQQIVAQQAAFERRRKAQWQQQQQQQDGGMWTCDA
jgi:hypothetical protein